jgi:hypothetical protein
VVGYEAGGDPSPIPYDNSKKCAEIQIGTNYLDGEQQEGCGQSCHLVLSMESTGDSQGTVEAQVYVQRKGSASASFLFGSSYNYGGGITYTPYDDDSCMGDRYYLVLTFHTGGVPGDPDFYSAELVLSSVTPALSEYDEDCCEKSVETSHCDGSGHWTP